MSCESPVSKSWSRTISDRSNNSFLDGYKIQFPLLVKARSEYETYISNGP